MATKNLGNISVTGYRWYNGGWSSTTYATANKASYSHTNKYVTLNKFKMPTFTNGEIKAPYTFSLSVPLLKGSTSYKTTSGTLYVYLCSSDPGGDKQYATSPSPTQAPSNYIGSGVVNYSGLTNNSKNISVTVTVDSTDLSSGGTYYLWIQTSSWTQVHYGDTGKVSGSVSGTLGYKLTINYDKGKGGSSTYSTNSWPVPSYADYGENYNGSYGLWDVSATFNMTKTGYVHNNTWTNGTKSMTDGNRTQKAEWYASQFGAGDLSTANRTINLVPKWTPKQLTVKFYRNHSSSDTYCITRTYTYDVSNQKFEDLYAGTKSGYTQLGWAWSRDATDDDYVTTCNVANSWINTNVGDAASNTVSLYAIWSASSRTLTVKPNGGEIINGSSETSNDFTVNFLSGRLAYIGNLTGSGTFYPDNEPTREGYTFNGYSASNGGYAYKNTSGNTFYFGTGTSTATNTNTWVFQGTGSDTLTATWTPKVFTITLSKESGTGGRNNVYLKYGTGWYYNSKATTSITDNKIDTLPSRSGHTFQGYYTEPNGEGERIVNKEGYLPSSTTKFSSDTTLYAYWTSNSTYTVTYKSGDFADGSDKLYSITNGGNHTVKDLSDVGMEMKPGYSFDDWYDMGHSRWFVAENEITNITENYTLVAQAIEKDYTYYLYEVDSSGSSSLYNHGSYNLGDELSLPSGGSGTAIQYRIDRNGSWVDGDTIFITEDICADSVMYFYFRHIEITSSTKVNFKTSSNIESYNVNGNLVTPGTSKIYNTSSISITGNYNPGYGFYRWKIKNIDAGTTSYSYNNTLSLTLSANEYDVTLESTSITYTVYYTTNKGSGSYNHTQSYGTTFSLYSGSGFQYSGYDLIGWENEDGNIFNLSASVTIENIMPADSIAAGNTSTTLTAVWNKSSTGSTYRVYIGSDSDVDGTMPIQSGTGVTLESEAVTVTSSLKVGYGDRVTMSATMLPGYYFRGWAKGKVKKINIPLVGAGYSLDWPMFSGLNDLTILNPYTATITDHCCFKAFGGYKKFNMVFHRNDGSDIVHYGKEEYNSSKLQAKNDFQPSSIEGWYDRPGYKLIGWDINGTTYIPSYQVKASNIDIFVPSNEASFYESKTPEVHAYAVWECQGTLQVQTNTLLPYEEAVPFLYTSDGWKQVAPWIYTEDGWQLCGKSPVPPPVPEKKNT